MKNALAILAIAGLLWVGLGGALPHVPLPIPHVVVEEPLIAGEGLHVLIVEEVDDRRSLSRDQLAVLTSSALRGWFTDHKAEWHVWDKDFDASHEPENWQAALKIPRESLPWLIVSRKGKPNYSGPLPATVDATLEVLRRYE